MFVFQCNVNGLPFDVIDLIASSSSLLTPNKQTNKQIFSINYDKTFYRLGKIQPRDLKLSDVMATSAAALALYMGVYDVMAERVRNLQMVLGVHFGKSLISDPSRDVAGSTIPCCRVRSILLLSPLRQTHRQV